MFRLKITRLISVVILFMVINTTYGEQNETTLILTTTTTRPSTTTTTTTTTTTPSGPRACESTYTCCETGCITIVIFDLIIFLVSTTMMGVLWWKIPWFCCKDKEIEM